MPDPQLALALGDRHAGQARNLAAGQRAHRDDRARVEVAVATLARSGTTWTADDVHRLVQHESKDPYDANLVSSVIGVWAQQHRIVEVLRPHTASARRTRRASRNRWWRGLRDTATAPLPRTDT